jgi:hypothetical protein
MVGKTEVLKICLKCYLVWDKFHIDFSGIEPKSPQYNHLSSGTASSNNIVCICQIMHHYNQEQMLLPLLLFFV